MCCFFPQFFQSVDFDVVDSSLMHVLYKHTGTSLYDWCLLVVADTGFVFCVPVFDKRSFVSLCMGRDGFTSPLSVLQYLDWLSLADIPFSPHSSSFGVNILGLNYTQKGSGYKGKPPSN